MYEKYKRVFRNGGSVRAVSSYVPRCLVSMAAFTGELLSREPGLDISWDTGEAFMNYCSSEDPDEIHDKARAIVREYAGTHSMDTVAFAGHLFTDEAAARAAIEIPMEDLMYGVLYMARVSGAFELDRLRPQDHGRGAVCRGGRVVLPGLDRVRRDRSGRQEQQGNAPSERPHLPGQNCDRPTSGAPVCMGDHPLTLYFTRTAGSPMAGGICFLRVFRLTTPRCRI